MAPRRELSRRTGTRPPRRRILIVCEGEQTEMLYFRALKRDFRLTAASIDIVSSRLDPEAIVREAARKREADRFDEAWCVFDVEFAPDNVRFPFAVDLAEREGISLAASNPAFEFWLLLHFVYTTRGFSDNDDLLRALRVNYSQYAKNQSCYEDLKPHQKQAIDHAKQVVVEQKRFALAEPFPQPSTSVHILVEYLSNQR